MLAADHGNLMAALRWSADHAPETGLRLVAALAAYWWLSGRRAEAGEPAARLLAVDAAARYRRLCHRLPARYGDGPRGHPRRAGVIGGYR